jgi:hypothetical protein
MLSRILTRLSFVTTTTMSASENGKKQCVKCQKGGGIMICDGCQQSFCGKHVNEHRQELTNQLDAIMQEYDVMQQELGRSSNEQVLLQDIDKWEEESIAKIRTAAEAVRENLRQISVESKEQRSKVCRDIARELRSSREADDFSENELSRWMEQIKELQLEIISPLPLKLSADNHSAISLITIQHDDSINKKPVKNKMVSLEKNLSTSNLQDRFWKVLGKVDIDKDGFSVKHIDTPWSFIRILGQQLYSQGRHVIRFKIERIASPSENYFGCISSQVTNDQIGYHLSFAVGWLGNKLLYQHGLLSPPDSQLQDSELKTNDILSLTFDCDNRQIELFHERINKTHQARVHLNRSPFPWRFLMVLGSKYDCVRILSN